MGATSVAMLDASGARAIATDVAPTGDSRSFMFRRRSILVAAAQRALHLHGVQPAAVLAAQAGKMPIVVKPSFSCSATDAPLPGSPITATICRKPSASQSAIRRASSARPTPFPCAARRDVHRVFHGPAIADAGAVAAGVGIAGENAIEFGHEVRISLLEQIAHAPRHLGFVRARRIRRWPRRRALPARTAAGWRECRRRVAAAQLQVQSIYRFSRSP